MENKWLEKPIFILGHPKSGTTLLNSILDNHPELINIPEETQFFRYIYPRIQKFYYKLSPKFIKRRIIIRDIFLNTYLRRLQISSPSEISGEIRDYSQLNFSCYKKNVNKYLSVNKLTEANIYKSLAYALNLQHPSQATVQGWVEKTPRNEIHTDKLIKWFPKAKFIHLLRDPRDNYVSLKKHRSKKKEITLDRFKKEWKEGLESGIRNFNSFGKNRYLILWYEDLCKAPLSYVMIIAAFLNIEVSPSMLIPTKFGTRWDGNSMFDQKMNGISLNSIGRYKDYPNQQEIEEIEMELIPDISKMMYNNIK